MITCIHVSSSQMVIHNEDDKKHTLPDLKKNQMISAKVLKLLPRGNAQLLINGQKVVAKTALLMKPGEQVQLKVLSQKDDIILKLIGPVQKMTTRQISSLVGFFSNNESIPDPADIKIKNVKELLYDMALKSDEPDKTFLPKLIEKSGMLWEKKVAQLLLGNDLSPGIKDKLDMLLKQDIKGNILKELSGADPGRFEALKTAAAFSETLENFQVLNHHSSDSGRFLLPFPIFSESAFSFGQLLIDTGDKTKKDNKDADKLIQLSFLLDMSRLGPLRADFSILKKKMTGRFLLKDEDTCKYVESMIPELKTRLASIDYQVHQITCITAEKKDIQHSSLIETLIKARDNKVLNIVI
ncbi:flagellar hook-length control protein FliK [Desulfobacula toluolica]|uniref:Conserved uncharacterized protein, associated with flagellar apparatus genes n=1 Tax=Desulfobacula toluolica (strain DSM 7467 / Tol2) TaxID=651182 RepID=K0NBK9_DESTT|nr:flagellar hook-length control protein FliK [Desulfobacula toluolica]CCK81719.1 conserved uncharacterized protein, associated with flagellar apparatus genes [Desulfobacula toluolica Tol2]